LGLDLTIGLIRVIAQ